MNSETIAWYAYERSTRFPNLEEVIEAAFRAGFEAGYDDATMTFKVEAE